MRLYPCFARGAACRRAALIVNPGSVGLPAYDDIHPFPHAIENGSPHAGYATVTRERGGWQASFHLVRYDWERTARYAEENGRADWARALRSGHA